MGDTNKGRVVLVGGGAGAVGEGIVKSLLELGWSVAVPVRNTTKIAVMKPLLDLTDNLYLIEADIGSLKGAMQAVAQTLDRFSRMDMAIASLGGWYQGGRLDTMPEEDWSMVLQNNLNTHFFFSKAVMGHFHRVGKGTFIMINGGAADMVVPSAGAMSIVARAQLAMTQVLASESAGTDIRVHSVMAITPVITRKRPIGGTGWITAKEIGSYVHGLYQRPTDVIVHRVPLNHTL